MTSQQPDSNGWVDISKETDGENNTIPKVNLNKEAESGPEFEDNGVEDIIKPVQVSSIGGNTIPASYVNELNDSSKKDDRSETVSVGHKHKMEPKEQDGSSRKRAKSETSEKTDNFENPVKNKSLLNEPDDNDASDRDLVSQIQASVASVTGGNSLPINYEKILQDPKSGEIEQIVEDPMIKQIASSNIGGTTIPQDYKQELEKPSTTVEPPIIQSVAAKTGDNSTIPGDYVKELEKTTRDENQSGNVDYVKELEKTTRDENQSGNVEKRELFGNDSGNLLLQTSTVQITGGKTIQSEYLKEIENVPDVEPIEASSVVTTGNITTISSKYKDQLITNQDTDSTSVIFSSNNTPHQVDQSNKEISTDEDNEMIDPVQTTDQSTDTSEYDQQLEEPNMDIQSQDAGNEETIDLVQATSQISGKYTIPSDYQAQLEPKFDVTKDSQEIKDIPQSQRQVTGKNTIPTDYEKEIYDVTLKNDDEVIERQKAFNTGESVQVPVLIPRNNPEYSERKSKSRFSLAAKVCLFAISGLALAYFIRKRLQKA